MIMTCDGDTFNCNCVCDGDALIVTVIVTLIVHQIVTMA